MSSAASPSSHTPEAMLSLLQQRFPDLPAAMLRQLLQLTSGDADAATNLLVDQQQPTEDEEEEEEEEGEGEGDVADGLQLPFGDTERRSVVEVHGSHASSCGYCHATTQSRRSFGATSPCMRCSDYAALMDVGWRRSGDYFYKPDNAACCCPNYTIRLDVRHFVISKAQRKVQRRFDRFLQGQPAEEGKEEDSQQRSNAADAAKQEQEDEHQTRLRAAIIDAVFQLQASGQLRTSLTEVSNDRLPPRIDAVQLRCSE